jgi:probable rRNA maturation factor
MSKTEENNNLTVEINCDIDDADIDIAGLIDLAAKICRRFDVNNAAVSIAIVDDKTIRGLNKKFLKKTNITDVISFDLTEPGENGSVFELVINADEAGRQAKTRNHSRNAELALYITHGLLHNLGFDDDNEKNAGIMHKMENDILSKEGFGLGVFE